MSYIGRMKSVSFDTRREPSPLGFIIYQNLHYISLGSLILTKLTMELIESPHLVTHSVLILGLSFGRSRSRMLFLFLQLRQSREG
jgi:hypothetical protein